MPPDVPASTAKVPMASLVLLISVMLLFFSTAMDITFQASWAWWILPLIALVVIVVILGQRSAARRRRLEELGGRT